MNRFEGTADQPVRTRFAPSPTGYMHLGNLRTALYEYLIAKRAGGQFILRIEDTDRKRYVKDAVGVIYSTLKLAGIIHTEGPDIGGPYGPYVQSERREIYREWAERLVERGGAYYCFCTSGRLAALKAQAQAEGLPYKYDAACRKLSQAEVAAKLAAGEPYVIRQKIPESGDTVFEDVVYGRIAFDNRWLDDQILVKSDGFPTYNFANVVDDHLMKISHVIRGNEFLPSTPKYSLLYKAFGWPEPVYVHLPPIRKADNQKLSKRFGDPSFQAYCRQGYLPEAIINYVALLGWNPGNGKEIFTLAELEREFHLTGLNKAPAVMNPEKLKWLNGEHLRRLPETEFYQVARPFMEQAVNGVSVDLEALSRILRKRIAVLGEIPAQLDFIARLPDYDLHLFENPKMRTGVADSLSHLRRVRAWLEALPEWTEEKLRADLLGLVAELGVKNGQVLWPLRVALTGKAASPGGGIELAALFGRTESLLRIETAIRRLMRVT
jgi:glutamyl-tRNA synthetase